MQNNYNTIMPVIAYRLITFQGKDTAAFLHAMTTQNLKNLPENTVRLTALCSSAGRVMANGYVWRHTDVWYWLVSERIADSLVKTLLRFRFRSAVDIALSDLPCAGLCGEAAETLLQRLGVLVPESADTVAVGERLTILRQTGDRFLLIGAGAAMVQAAASEAGFQRASAQMWSWLDVMAGWPTIYPDTQDLFILQQINLDWLNAIDFQKGCFPGQEVIARVRYLGKNNKRMFLFHLAEESLLSPGDPVYRGELAIGKIVDAQRNPYENGMDCLVIINQEEAQKPGLSTVGGALIGPIALTYVRPETAV